MRSRKPKGRPLKASHLDNLLANLQEIGQLLNIHTKIAGSTVGAKYNVEVLNKSGIVLLVACWEVFIEDLAKVSFQLQLRRAKRPDSFSSKSLALVSRALREDKDERRVWDLAGDGWKTVLRAHQSQVLKRYVGNFNTPKPKQIDELFISLIGVSNISKKWSWHKCTPAQARNRLDKLVTLRGEIAHRVAAPRSVHKSHVKQAATFVGRLAVATHNAVNASLGSQFGYTPWQEYTYHKP